MIAYKQFVKELPSLIEEAESLKPAARFDKDPQFRKWRHRVTELIKQIEDQGYLVNCNIKIRRFGPDRQRSPREGYVGDLADTMIELETIVDHYNKFGAPKQESSTLKLIESGHVPTIREMILSLRVHHGWKTLIVIIGIIVSLLSIGFTVGVIYQKYFADYAQETTVLLK